MDRISAGQRNEYLHRHLQVFKAMAEPHGLTVKWPFFSSTVWVMRGSATERYDLTTPEHSIGRDLMPDGWIGAYRERIADIAFPSRAEIHPELAYAEKHWPDKVQAARAAGKKGKRRLNVLRHRARARMAEDMA